MQWATTRTRGPSRHCSGPASLLADDGKTAQIPDAMRTADKWFNDGVWKDHFIPTQNAILSDLLGKGNEFASGNLAMNEVHTWFACCVNPAAPAKPIVGDNFGWAVAPSYNGKTTAKLHADTFSMLKTTKHPDAAFAVLSALAGLRRSGDHLRRHAGRSDPAAGLHRRGQQGLPEGEARLVRAERRCSAPGHPQPPGMGPGLRQVKAAWQAFGIRLPHHARASTSTPSSTR